MHGRLKVRTTEEQQLLKKKEQQKKLTAYRLGMKQILESRKADSYDRGSLAISTQLLIVNPDIYTLWNYRKEVVLLEIEASKKQKDNNVEDQLVIEANKNQEDNNGEAQLVSFLENELKLTEHCLLSNPKSYNSWHHRYWILQHHPKANWQNEFDLLTKYLSKDDRNFHCWDYRRQILNKIGMVLDDEIKFSTDQINVNFSNYSSWHYRSTLLKHEHLRDELVLVQNAVFTDPSDSSAWFYLRWILSNPTITNQDRQELLEALEQLLELEPDCRWILVAKCWLAKSLNHLVDDRVKCLKKLECLDSLRKGQYLDYQQTIIASKAEAEN